MAINNRVIITKTPKEWLTIDKRLKELMPDLVIDSKKREDKSIEELRKEMNKKDMERFNRYLNGKISHLINDYEKCPDCIKKLIPLDGNPKRQKCLSEVWYDKLNKISDELNVPISTIIDRIIITPLLIEK